MKSRLTFWIVYVFSILIIALHDYPLTLKKSEVGITTSTIELIKHFEGVKNQAYDDGYGNMTIGVGHLIRNNEAHLYYATLSDRQVEDLLLSDMRPCEGVIKSGVTLPLTQGQFDALMSLCFNIGHDNFKRSHTVHYLNGGDYMLAAKSMLNWDNPKSLTKRRYKEHKLFLQGA
jgi:GH24 family phage-related lysozyme (muramidase)